MQIILNIYVDFPYKTQLNITFSNFLFKRNTKWNSINKFRNIIRPYFNHLLNFKFGHNSIDSNLQLNTICNFK